jgi:hypothetical protein
VFFYWLTSRVADRNLQSCQFASYILTEFRCRPSKLSLASLTDSAFDCFQSYFIVNHSTDSIIAMWSEYEVKLTVTALRKLTGMDCLWSMVTSSPSQVALRAGTLLLLLHLRLDSTHSTSEREGAVEQFVDRCLLLIARLVRAGSNEWHSSLLLLTVLERGEFLDTPRFCVGEVVRTTWKWRKGAYAEIRAINKTGTYRVVFSNGSVNLDVNEAHLRSTDKALDESHTLYLKAQAQGKLGHDDHPHSIASFARSALSTDRNFMDALSKMRCQANSTLSQHASDLLSKLPQPVIQPVDQQLSDAQDALLCKVCYDQNINTFLSPCRHSCCCLDCGQELDVCPICRTDIELVEQIYRS